MRRLDTREGPLETWVTITGAAVQPGRGADEETLPKAASAPPAQTVNNVHTAHNSPFGNTVNGGISYRTDDR
jgi:hypothetical protein